MRSLEIKKTFLFSVPILLRPRLVEALARHARFGRLGADGVKDEGVGDDEDDEAQEEVGDGGQGGFSEEEPGDEEGQREVEREPEGGHRSKDDPGGNPLNPTAEVGLLDERRRRRADLEKAADDVGVWARAR